MDRKKYVLALLLAVLFPITSAVCTPKPMPEPIWGRITVEKTAEKFVVLIETIVEPSVASLRRITFRDKTTGGVLHLGGCFIFYRAPQKRRMYPKINEKFALNPLLFTGK